MRGMAARGESGWESRLLSRDSVAAGLALAVVGGLSWWYLFRMAEGMVPATRATSLPEWTPVYFVMMVVMWGVMMVAMMLPSAAPMILLYRQVARRNRIAGVFRATALFALGYFTLWLCFSLAATSVQWWLESLALLSPMMRSQSSAFSGAILILAGVYQWSPLKQTCLHHCRAPLLFLARHWHPGLTGAFRMGVAHGAYCIGCCGALMALLFVGGVMNLAIVAVIAVLVLLEKLVPGGQWLAVLSGLVAFVLGLGFLVSVFGQGLSV